MKTWPANDPDEVLDYDLDWTARLYSADELDQVDAGEAVTPTDTIASLQFILPDGAMLVASSSTYTSTHTKIWLRGGDEGAAYLVLNRITMSGGRTMDQTVKLNSRASRCVVAAVFVWLAGGITIRAARKRMSHGLDPGEPMLDFVDYRLCFGRTEFRCRRCHGSLPMQPTMPDGDRLVV